MVSDYISPGVQAVRDRAAAEAYDRYEARKFNALNTAAIDRADADPIRTSKRLVTNAGIAKEAYFKSYSAPSSFNTGASGAIDGRSGLWRILQTDSSGNTPTYSSSPTELWSQSKPYKGMITSYRGTYLRESTDDTAADKAATEVSRADRTYYGFQFHYNPTSISMSYGGVRDIDPTVYTSGTERFNLLGANIGMSAITFNLLLNRINDQKFFTNQGTLKPGISANMFAGRAPDARELQDIYNKGTMYDIEFLLRTVMGVQMHSYLGRNLKVDNKTSDMGFLTGWPIEVHLGKSLRYYGRIEAFNLTHVLFTERMVPTFSEVSITVLRMPDPPRTNPSTASTPDTTAPTYQTRDSYLSLPAARAANGEEVTYEMVGP